MTAQRCVRTAAKALIQNKRPVFSRDNPGTRRCGACMGAQRCGDRGASSGSIRFLELHPNFATFFPYTITQATGPRGRAHRRSP
ncbi:hypothetical protein [Azospirillum melinis]